MNDLRRFIRRYLKLSSNQKKIFIQAYILSGIMRFIILFIPFKYIKKYIGEYKGRTSNSLSDSSKEQVYEIQSILNLVWSHTPWRSECLVQALVTQYFLTKRKLPSTLYLGVRKTGEASLNAHAWLRCGDIVLTGGSEKHLFKEVACFARKINQ